MIGDYVVIIVVVDVISAVPMAVAIVFVIMVSAVVFVGI